MKGYDGDKACIAKAQQAIMFRVKTLVNFPGAAGVTCNVLYGASIRWDEIGVFQIHSCHHDHMKHHDDDRKDLRWFSAHGIMKV